jgi:hypothetical protein
MIDGYAIIVGYASLASQDSHVSDTSIVELVKKVC